MIYAVIDTNVLLSALITKNRDASTVKVLEAVFAGNIIPLYHSDIIAEYNDVLHREKFKIDEMTIRVLLNSLITYGVEVFPSPTGEVLVDPDDLIFYEVVMEKRDEGAYLVTGNQKHYPTKAFVVTPAEMIDILTNTMERNEKENE